MASAGSHDIETALGEELESQDVLLEKRRAKGITFCLRE
jgi:hypothetical protein